MAPLICVNNLIPYKNNHSRPRYDNERILRSNFFCVGSIGLLNDCVHSKVDVFVWALKWNEVGELGFSTDIWTNRMKNSNNRFSIDYIQLNLVYP